MEVGDEGRLAEGGGDDAGAVAVGHAAEGTKPTIWRSCERIVDFVVLLLEEGCIQG